jgi:voltage-gated potassium channel
MPQQAINHQEPEYFLTGDERKDVDRIVYVLFISIVSVMAVAVGVAYYLVPNAEVKEVLRILDTIYAFVFLADFALRMWMANDRRGYFFRLGWLDLITSLPGIPALRIIRGVITIRHARRFFDVTPDELDQIAQEQLAQNVLFITILLGLVVISVGSILIVLVEPRAADGQIQSGGDAMWWSLVTISTVGYGDEVPVTPAGRWIAAFTIVVGVAIFTTVTSFLSSTFVGRNAKRQREEQIALARANAAQLEAMVERILILEEKIASALDIADTRQGEPAGDAGQPGQEPDTDG